MTLLDNPVTSEHPPSLTDYDLARRYQAGAGPVLLTGVQAIARLLVEQHQRDANAGRNTASFVSGYQGSPLGGVDRMLLGMPDVLEGSSIKLVPGLNEELAATAVWGSQSELPGAKPLYDGVVGVWYGKGPGVDRAMDCLRHANMYGVNANGGVLLLVGDDPASKSSTVPAVSERTLAALNIPVLFPRNATEIVQLGMQGIALSRASGCIVALKIVADVADGAWVVDESVGEVRSEVPEVHWRGRPYVYQQRPMAVASHLILPAEEELFGPRSETVTAFAALNAVNQVEVATETDTVGIVASGTAFDSLRQALVDLGLADDDLRRAGIRLLRLGMMSPLEPGIVRRFAAGLRTVLVVEDKTPFIETEVRTILYGRPHAPAVIGKTDADGKPLVPSGGELTAGRLHAALRRVLSSYAELAPPPPARIDLPLLPVARAPYFCSGCPHNRSTAVPEGSLAGGGIGCHIMVTTSGRQDSEVVGLTQMGGEGAQWIGQAAFSDVGHLFQNLGDGTFFHSGQLAVQACVAAGVDITFKLLYNDVVAMTGAQDAEGALSVDRLTHKLHAERVARIIVCAEDPKRYRRHRLAPGTEVWHRDRLDEAQRTLRETKGVTVLIYDQHCAADARRRRKRGQLEPRPTRVVINEAVCEGCGDCGVRSNCLSVQPVDTELGRKTRIDQTSCNTDYTCLQGDCPSFVTLQLPEGTSRPPRRTPEPPASPEPPAGPVQGVQNVFMAGIGGTGILTVNQVLATAALMAGLEVESLDQTGLSQKAGPVTGHLRFSADPIEPANRLSPGSADCLLAFDLLTATTERSLSYGDAVRSVAVASTSRTPTGDMVYDKDVAYPATDELLERLASASREVHALDALAAAEQLFGDTTYANFLVVGAAHQAGALRIPAEAIEAAIEVNGTAVAKNVAAFRWGRASVAHPSAFADAVAPEQVRTPRRIALDPATPVPEPHRDFVERRAADLSAFQGPRTAAAYVRRVEEVARAEARVSGSGELTGIVAQHLYRLTAYKDEYEVARLLTDRGAIADVRSEVPGGTKPTYHLHPPVLRALGVRSKLAFRPGTHWVLRVLARLRFLRGTPLDVFGYAKVRRWERELVRHYAETVEGLCRVLDANSYERALAVAALPGLVRGFEDIKLDSIEAYVDALGRHGVVPPRLGGSDGGE